jgi:hypothetical protein
MGGEAAAESQALGDAYGGETPPLPLPPEVVVGVVGVVVVVEVVDPVVVGEVVFVVVVEPVVVVDPVVVGADVREDAVEAVEELLPLLSAITTTATIRPTITAISPAISRWMFPRGLPPPGPRSSGPIILVGSSCTYSSGPSIASRIPLASSISNPLRSRASISSLLLPETAI